LHATLRVLIVVAIAACAIAAAAPAEAAFPGANGRIAFVTVDAQFHRYVWTVNPDGSDAMFAIADSDEPEWMPDGSRLLVARAGSSATEIWSVKPDGSDATFVADGNSPAPSPDGTKIAFEAFPPGGPSSEIYVMNADGTGAAQLTSEPDAASRPAWSPDGKSIAFNRAGINGGVPGIYLMDAAGSNQVRISATKNPNWSPDGAKIVHECGPDPSGDICVMDRDGGNDTDLTPGPSSTPAHFPAWSPDGKKIIYFEAVPNGGGNHIVSMNADGTGKTNVVDFPINATSDWQPIPLNYVRPRGAGPFLTDLVPAYNACTTPNRTHGAPLAFDSCAPPTQTSTELTLGTPDANGLPAATVGSVRYRIATGDVKIDVNISGVLAEPSLAPYGGELALAHAFRITDRDNTPNPGGPGPGTVQDASFGATLPCAAGTCTLATTANALAPGAVVQGRRTIWQVGQVDVYDGGADGIASTTGDNTLFMVEGVFIP
jgi:TolB protein